MNNILELYALKVTGIEGQEASLSGDIIENAEIDIDNQTALYVVELDMNDKAAMDWARMTKEASKNAADKREIAIVLDDLVYTAPTVHNEIPNGKSQITGNFTESEADYFANVLKLGRLPVALTILSLEHIGHK
jgi:SecD/SecF fusion protein